MSELKATLKASMTAAMKARDAARLQTIRLLLSAIQKKEVDDAKDLPNEGAEKVLLTFLKQLQESLEQAKSAGRADLATAAEAEMVIVKEFLPKAMSQEDVESTIAAIVAELKAAGSLPAGPAAMGAVMKQAVARIGARSEGKIIQLAVKKALG